VFAVFPRPESTLHHFRLLPDLGAFATDARVGISGERPATCVNQATRSIAPCPNQCSLPLVESARAD
jgi:hypothetical protein